MTHLDDIAARQHRAMMARAEAILIRAAIFAAGWITGCVMCASIATGGL